MANDIISREDARVQGLKSYFSGVLCRNGHSARRSVKFGHCLGCSVEKTRQYRAFHPGWATKVGQKWRDENRERLRAKGRARYAKNPEKHRDQVKRSYLKNSDRIKRVRKELHHFLQRSSPEYREKAVERAKIWALNNPEKAKTQRRNQKAKRKLVPGRHTESDIREILKMQKGKCAYCRIKLTKYQVDHIIAVAKGGTNHRHNVQVACGPCNRSKSDKDPIDFARSLGKLL